MPRKCWRLTVFLKIATHLEVTFDMGDIYLPGFRYLAQEGVAVT